MKKQFYSHLVETEILLSELNNIKLKPHERHELVTLVHTTIHHVVIDVVLTELNENEQKIFLKNLSNKDHSHIWKHLFRVVEDIEEKIKKTSSIIIKELKRDLDEIRNTL